MARETSTTRNSLPILRARLLRRDFLMSAAIAPAPRLSGRGPAGARKAPVAFSGDSMGRFRYAWIMVTASWLIGLLSRVALLSQGPTKVVVDAFYLQIGHDDASQAARPVSTLLCWPGFPEREIPFCESLQADGAGAVSGSLGEELCADSSQPVLQSVILFVASRPGGRGGLRPGEESPDSTGQGAW